MESTSNEKAISAGETADEEVLIVVSKLKNYIQKKAGMNTSGKVPEVLSQKVRALCDAAIEQAKSDGRKTVMDRDFADA